MKHLFAVIIFLFSFVFHIPAAGQGGKEFMTNGRNLVILIHGFHKGAVDMQFWKDHLSMENTDVLTPDLPTVFESFEYCLEVFCKRANCPMSNVWYVWVLRMPDRNLQILP